MGDLELWLLKFLVPPLLGATLGGLFGWRMRRPISGTLGGLVGGVVGAWIAMLCFRLSLPEFRQPPISELIPKFLLFLLSGLVIGAILLSAVFTMLPGPRPAKPKKKLIGPAAEDSLHAHRAAQGAVADQPRE
jgi:hypothetical protein